MQKNIGIAVKYLCEINTSRFYRSVEERGGREFTPGKMKNIFLSCTSSNRKKKRKNKNKSKDERRGSGAYEYAPIQPLSSKFDKETQFEIQFLDVACQSLLTTWNDFECQVGGRNDEGISLAGDDQVDEEIDLVDSKHSQENNEYSEEKKNEPENRNLHKFREVET